MGSRGISDGKPEIGKEIERQSKKEPRKNSNRV